MKNFGVTWKKSKDIAELSSENVDRLSDCEDIGENILEDTTTKDVPAHIEMHLLKSSAKSLKNQSQIGQKSKTVFPQFLFKLRM